jgi:hypothetical protein
MYHSPTIVTGFHGCEESVVERILLGEKLLPSKNAYDWLGHGIYFWEGSYDRALRWADKNPDVKNPAVLGAIIHLGNCLDLLDTEHTQTVRETYELLKKELAALGMPLPSNTVTDKNGISFNRELDCMVILRLHKFISDSIRDELGDNWPRSSRAQKRAIQNHPAYIDSIRGMFPEGDALYPEAGFREQNHIQLCITNPNCVLGYFMPRQQDAMYKQLT